MFVQLFLVHVGEFGTSRNEHRKNILFFVFWVFPVVFQKTGNAHFLKQIL